MLDNMGKNVFYLFPHLNPLPTGEEIKANIYVGDGRRRGESGQIVESMRQIIESMRQIIESMRQIIESMR
jgi:hypothetical protein